MSTAEILTLIGIALAIFGGIAGIWIKTAVSISKMQIQIIEIQRDLVAKELAILLIEKNNRDDFRDNKKDHEEIIKKIDKLSGHLMK